MCLINTTVFAQQTGIVQYPEYGIEFTIPEGWMGKELQESYAMKSQTLDGVMLLYLNENNSIKAIKNEFSQDFVEAGVNLKPEVKLEVKKDYVKRYYKGIVEGDKVKALAIGQLNTFGKSVSLVIMTKSEAFTNAHEKALMTLKESLKFNEPQVNATFNATICKRDLAGYKLTYEKYNYSSGGVGGISGSNSVSSEINLCKSGHFTFYGGVNVNVGGENSHGYSHSTSKDHGKWQFVDKDGKVFLHLNYYNGDIYYYQITYGKDGGTYLDNTRYFLTDVNCN